MLEVHVNPNYQPTAALTEGDKRDYIKPSSLAQQSHPARLKRQPAEWEENTCKAHDQ